MLLDFPVAVSWAGERYTVICRDVATAVFFYGFPNSLPATPCYDEASKDEQRNEVRRLEDWMYQLLPRVAVEPVLTDETVRRLDEGALEGVVGYLHAVGWIPTEDLQKYGGAATRYQQSIGALADQVLQVQTTQAPVYKGRHLPFVQEMAPNIRMMLREVAKLAHVRPSVLWQTPISEFLMDYRLLVQDERKDSNNVLTGDDARIGFAA